GIDPNVVGRLLVETVPEPDGIKITRICALDLSPESHGNGTGVGIADVTTDRLLAKIDPVPFRMNNLTACFLAVAPAVGLSDRPGVHRTRADDVLAAEPRGSAVGGDPEHAGGGGDLGVGAGGRGGPAQVAPGGWRRGPAAAVRCGKHIATGEAVPA